MNIAIFLDYPSMEKETNRLNCLVNYGQVVNYLTAERELHQATAFIPLCLDCPHQFDDLMDELSKQFQIESKLGYVEDDELICDYRVDFTTHILRTAYEEKVDGIVIMSNDTTYGPLLIHLRKLGLHVQLVTLKEAIPASFIMKATEHLNLLDYMIDLKPTKKKDPQPYHKIVEELNRQLRNLSSKTK